MIRRLTAGRIATRKSERFPVVTAYDASFARIVERAGIDIVLVGDSLGMVVLGFESTVAVDLDDMIRHGAAVARGTAQAHVIVDLPFGSYESSNEAAIASAVRLVKDGGACSVKLEGGLGVAPRIAAITGAGIPVVAHLGVLPQTAALATGFRRRTDRETLFDDVRAVVAAGAFAVVLEMVDAEIAAEISRTFAVPTIGIGSGPACDGQVLVLHDVLGLYDASPPFARRYADLGAQATNALEAFAADVRGGVCSEGERK